MKDCANDFDFCTPTRVLFGKDKINELPKVLGAFGKKVLLVYGGGSIKKNGIYTKIQELLKDFDLFELSGVEPNPRVSSVRAGAKICKEQNIDVVLAVGGGSVLDCSKIICDAAFYDGDAWDLVIDGSKIPSEAIVIMGSGYNDGAAQMTTQLSSLTITNSNVSDGKKQQSVISGIVFESEGNSEDGAEPSQNAEDNSDKMQSDDGRDNKSDGTPADGE